MDTLSEVSRASERASIAFRYSRVARVSRVGLRYLTDGGGGGVRLCGQSLPGRLTVPDRRRGRGVRRCGQSLPGRLTVTDRRRGRGGGLDCAARVSRVGLRYLTDGGAGGGGLDGVARVSRVGLR